MANTQNLDLVKPLGTDHALVSVLNSNSDKIDAYAGAVNAGLDGLRGGLGILANGNTHAAITSGQYVYVKNHGSLPEGLYKATANIAANGTLSTSNLAADSAGGLNSLNEQIGTKLNVSKVRCSSPGEYTFTFPANTAFVVAVSSINTTTNNSDGFYVGFCHNNANIRAIASADYVTITISGKTLTINTGVSNIEVMIMY